MSGVSQSLGVTVNLDLDPWTDLSRDRMPPLGRTPMRVIVIAETTLRLFLTASAAVGACPVAQLEDL